jgi:hypothetical protein
MFGNGKPDDPDRYDSYHREPYHSYADPKHFHAATLAEDVDARIRRFLIERLENVVQAEEARIEDALKPSPERKIQQVKNPHYGLLISGLMALLAVIIALNGVLIYQSAEQSRQMDTLIELLSE